MSDEFDYLGAPAAAAAVHTHTESDVTSLTADLAAKAAASHSHVESDVTSLTTDLAAKLAKGSNLSDLASVSTARTNLALGGAALLAVGTAAGTVAAGDDSRITGAVPASTATTKGDLLAATASATVARLGVGSDGQVLTGLSSATSGVVYARPVHIMPADHGMLLWNYDPAMAFGTAGAPTSAVLQVFKLNVPYAMTITNVLAITVNSPSSLSGVYGALYDSTGITRAVGTSVGDYFAAANGQIDAAQRLDHPDLGPQQVAHEIADARRTHALAVHLPDPGQVNDGVRSRGSASIQCGHSDGDLG